jgi:hypothetical protein
MSQDLNTNKNEQYKELLKIIIPFTKSDNKIEKRAAYDFIILLKSAINETNNLIFLYLNNSINHVIEHFKNNLFDLINNKIDPNTSINDSIYGLLNDIAKSLLRQLVFKNNLQEFNEFLLKI